MVAPGRWFMNQLILALKFLTDYVHRSTLPQSRFARQLPQGGSRGTFPFNRVLAKIRGYGRFSSPLRNSECLTAPIHRRTLPQSASLTAPSGREPGNGGAAPFNRVLAKPQGYGRFSSPLRSVPFNRPPGKRKVSGDFRRPKRSECFTFYHSTGVGGVLGGFFCGKYGK